MARKRQNRKQADAQAAPKAPGVGHNLTAMKADIKQAADKIIGLNSRIKELQEQRTQVRSQYIKAHGIKASDFQVALRLYQLEGSDRDDSLDALRIAFEALGVGGQGSLFPDRVYAPGGAPINEQPGDEPATGGPGITGEQLRRHLAEVEGNHDAEIAPLAEDGDGDDEGEGDPWPDGEEGDEAERRREVLAGAFDDDPDLPDAA